MSVATASDAARLGVQADLGRLVPALDARQGIDAIFSVVLFQVRLARMSEAVDDIVSSCAPLLADGANALGSPSVSEVLALWGLDSDIMHSRLNGVLGGFHGTPAALRANISMAMLEGDEGNPAGFDLLPEDPSSLVLKSITYTNPVDLVFLAGPLLISGLVGAVWVIEKAQNILKSQLDIEKSQLDIEKSRLDIEKSRLDIEKSRLDIEKSRLDIEKTRNELHSDEIESSARPYDARRRAQWRHLDAAHRTIGGQEGAQNLDDSQVAIGATVDVAMRATLPIEAFTSTPAARAARDLSLLPRSAVARLILPGDPGDRDSPA